MTGKALSGFVAAALVTFGLAGPSQAIRITREFEGTVRSFTAADSDTVTLAGSLGVAVDAPVSGRVVYESTTPPFSPASETFVGAVTGFDLTVGSQTASLDRSAGFNSFFVRLLRPDFDFDLEFAQAIGTSDALFPSVPILTLSLLADVAGVIPDTSLPTDPTPLSALLDDGAQALVELSRLERVPEPGLASLLAPGLLALAALRRRAW